MNPVRSGDIRETNEKLILRLIRDGGGVSQSEVVHRTGLRAPTVLRFFNHLGQQGFIRRVDREPAGDRRGRKPVYYEPVPESAYALGMEFWAGSASAAVLDFAGNLVWSHSRALKPADRSDVLGLLRSLYREALEGSGIPGDRLIGLCVAAPGQVDVETGALVQYSRLGIADIDLRRLLEAELKVPVIVQNNSAAVAWDEYRRGAGKDVRSLFTVMIRAGVGGAFLDDGEIFVTKTHTTLEIGHIAVEYNGRLCDCGSRGCLETYLSEQAILNDLAPVVPRVSISRLDRLIRQNRPDVRAVLDLKAGVLAQAVKNLVSLFGPEMVLIVTRSPLLGRYLADRVREDMNSWGSSRWQGRTRIESALYEPEKAGRGAADLVYKNFFA